MGVLILNDGVHPFINTHKMKFIFYLFNPLLHRLFLDHDIIFYFWTTLKKFKKNLSIFENIMENGAFALLEQMLHFP